jgi:hypothetical protein
MTGIRRGSGSSAGGSRRWALVALAVLGIGLALAPVGFKMFERGPKGAQMMDEFKPFMTDARLSGFQRDIRQIDAAVHQTNGRAVVRLEGHGAAAHDRFDRRFPGFAQFREDWPPINADMSNLMSLIKDNAGNYRAVAALPSFRIFPWFFVIPGVLLALLAIAGLLAPRARPGLRWAFAALGIGLVLAPAGFQMFQRAPKGARMMTAFKTIETRKKVETIQGYFATIAVGQGALRLDVVPALKRTGLSDRDIAARYSDVDTLDRNWIPILNDMTPMIGAMSDNVDNYDAIRSLPDFRLFPWFFVAPGLLILALALLPGRRRRRSAARATSPLPTPSRGGAV